jgi:myo-inositol catabolism protein IolC
VTDSLIISHAQNRVLLILAADDRDSLERDLYRLTAPPTPAQAARISADKLLIYQALLDAAAQLPADIEPGVLIDEKYGASVAELAACSGGAISLCMPVETSGREWFDFAYDDWQRHAGFFAAGYAKVLVRDNPGLDPALREQQTRRLAQVSAWAAEAGRSLILELLVPARRRFPAGPGSRSAAASGGTRCTLTCATSAPPGRRGAASRTRTSATPATTSAPGTAC